MGKIGKSELMTKNKSSEILVDETTFLGGNVAFFREKVAFFMKLHQLQRTLTLGFLLAHLGFFIFIEWLQLRMSTLMIIVITQCN